MCAAITATTQQSRFHAETLEAPTQEVDLRGLALAAGDAELLAGAHLKLAAGTRYGLVGRNGVGKSTLLKAVGWGLVVGFPKSLRCLYVDQLEGVDPEQSPVEVVVAADSEAQRAQREAAALQAALEGGEPGGMARTLRQLAVARAEEAAAGAAQTAERRSGERGLAARQALVGAEAALAEARARLDAPLSAQEEAAAQAAAQDLLIDLFDRLALREPEEAEAAARSILTGLGLSTAQQEAPLGQLSGGWRIRASLAQALFLQPDLLLLDEPTNHLDLPGIVWLSRYLRTQMERSTLVVVSHDRAFLNAVAQEIVVFKKRQLSYYTGNYDEYEQQVEEKQLHQQRLADGIERKREHAEKSIQEGLKQAKKAGDDKKLGMVASRKKKLENRMGMEKNAAGHRLRVHKDFVGYFDSARQQAEVEEKEVVPPWKVPQPDLLRHKGPLVQLEGAACGYSRQRPVLPAVTLCVEQGERVALVGPNGEGKSTLLKTLVGQLPALAGTVTTHGSARVAYFQQTQVEEMCGNGGPATALAYMQERWPAVREQELRNHLGSYGIKGGTATQPLTTLSGGQAVRIALAAAFFARPHLLVLDEPSNHLDLEGVESLVAALEGFEGGVLLVSHDQYLVQQAAQRVCLVAAGEVRRLEGGIVEYVQQLSGKKRASIGGGGTANAAGKGGAAAAALALLPEAAAAGGGAAAAAAAATEVAGGGAAAALSLLLSKLDPHVLGATVGASAKLAMVCALVGWLLKTKQLPNNTASVMSKVSFTLLIPAMLFTKVAATLAAAPDPAILATISFFTVAQIVAGAALGGVLAPLVDRLPWWREEPGSASGEGETGLRQLVTLASSFGSSFTLPVVFFHSMLAPAAAERALGYTALILLSWSPLMWSLGLSIVNGGGSSGGGGKGEAAPGAAAAGGRGPRATSVAAAAALCLPAADGAALVGALRAAAQQAAAFGGKVLTPPFLAILAGMAVGLTPVGRALLGGGSAAAATAAWGGAGAAVAAAGSAVLRSALDVVKMLAGGTLAAQTVVLAASLLQQSDGQEQAAAAQHEGCSRGSGGGPFASLARLLLPESGVEARALLTVAITRFLLLPALTCGAVWGLGRAGLLPAAVAADPILLLVLLVEAVMPSAQMGGWGGSRTAGLAPTLAHMLLRLYIYSVLPVSIWVTAWASWLGVAVA
ncbi:ABC transporter ATP-binding [Micractinium conductrix]|uniref:ABC transporter ATP-binding n=1 Tax=Micractinium conductrix TaxID=554055 RepID=A0A2P6V1F6_9CHLO|nr:ABC transporter ATP-binding [Micractinium conductrix]|eukprot:PSC67915.1 ABC transporter ATP-binding [Micractinium conductrix]